MKQSVTQQDSRRNIAHLSTFGTTMMHLRSPLVIFLWSVAFPGLGHILLCKYLRGILLFLWELLINYKAKVNLMIFFSFIGDYEQAKSIADIRWLSLYIPTYVFAIWDSYRTCVDINHNYVLAVREDAPLRPFQISVFEVNYLDKRKPWVAAAWSMLMPGAGQLYLHRIVEATFIILWWITIVYYSKLLPVIHYTFLGHFELSRAVSDIQWYLNIPSIYLFAAYHSYVSAVENNKLFEMEQSRFLKHHYQAPGFQVPLGKKCIGDRMYIISTFEHSKYLELAITALQMKGVRKEDILAVPMDKRAEAYTLFDSIHGSDGKSLLDIPMILAVLFGVFGSIYGFVWYWGPLIWGLIFMGIGASIGLLIKYFTIKKDGMKQRNAKNTEVVLMIGCTENQAEMIKDMLWAHYALGVRKLDLDSSS